MDRTLKEITRGKYGWSVNGDHKRKIWTECKRRSQEENMDGVKWRPREQNMDGVKWRSREENMDGVKRRSREENMDGV